MLFTRLFILPGEPGYSIGGTVVVGFGKCPTLVGEIIHLNEGNGLLGRGKFCIQGKKCGLGRKGVDI